MKYIYVDTEDHLSERIFANSGIGLSHVKEMIKEDCPFRLIVCWIRKKDAGRFHAGLEKLRNSVLICGYKGYDEICDLLKKAEKGAANE
jgi:hypothetical protein